MKAKPKITRIETFEFEYEKRDVGLSRLGSPVYEPGADAQWQAYAIRIDTDIGIAGEYVGGSGIEYAGIKGFASYLVGRNALDREDIYNDIKY